MCYVRLGCLQRESKELYPLTPERINGVQRMGRMPMISGMRDIDQTAKEERDRVLIETLKDMNQRERLKNASGITFVRSPKRRKVHMSPCSIRMQLIKESSTR